MPSYQSLPPLKTVDDVKNCFIGHRRTHEDHALAEYIGRSLKHLEPAAGEELIRIIALFLAQGQATTHYNLHMFAIYSLLLGYFDKPRK
jgi:hypothetical protein